MKTESETMFNMKLEPDLIKRIVGNNPEISIIKIYSDAFKLGMFEFQLENKLINMDVNVKIKVPREQVIDVLESGKKIGTWILKVSPEGKLAKNKVVKFFATHYVNIDLFIA